MLVAFHTPKSQLALLGGHGLLCGCAPLLRLQLVQLSCEHFFRPLQQALIVRAAPAVIRRIRRSNPHFIEDDDVLLVPLTRHRLVDAVEDGLPIHRHIVPYAHRVLVGLGESSLLTSDNP